MYDPDTQPLTDEELDRFLRELEKDLEGEDARIEREERILKRVLGALLAGALLLMLFLSLSACGGETSEEPSCRPDFVGPPAPSQAHLPIC